MSDEEDERPSWGEVRGGFGSRNLDDFGWGTPNAKRASDEDEGRQPQKRPRFGRDSPQSMASDSYRGGAGGSGMSFAQRQMAKMGYKEGQGLGAQGTGRLNPIEVVQRPMGAGVGLIREKTKQAKEEEKRAAAFRGEVLEDSSDEERKRKKASKEARRVNQNSRTGPLKEPSGWNIKYVTVDELRADLAGSNVPRSLLEFAIDLTGKKVSGGTDTFVPAQSNSTGKSEADKLAKKIQRELVSCAESKHGLNNQRATLTDYESHLLENIDQQENETKSCRELLEKVTELQELRLRTGEINEQSMWDEITVRLESFANANGFDSLLDFKEVVVAALHPLLHNSLFGWRPISKPTFLIDYFLRLNKAMKGSSASVIARESDQTPSVSRSKRSTDVYGSMMHSLWLPRVASAVRSEMRVEHPDPVIELVKAWRPVLPPFVYSQLINENIKPKLLNALKAWKPPRHGRRGSVTPDAWIFPWLEYLNERDLDIGASFSFISDVRAKLRKLLDVHQVQYGIPFYLPPWKNVLGHVYSQLVTECLLPRLSAYLSKQLVIDPSDQDTRPLDTVLGYSPLFSVETMAHLLAAEFFPKFHAVLYQWLISPSANYDEVTQWWTWWKGQIPVKIREHPVLEPQWTRALTTIGRALDLGERAAKELTPPINPKDIPSQTEPNVSPWTGLKLYSPYLTTKPEHKPAHLQREFTFRDIVTDWCAEHDLLCLPTREAHAGTGEPLLRITASIDQRGGVLAYIRGDVLYARNKRDRSFWEPIGLGEKLEKRASER